jgi:gas vesicle protein
LRTLDHVAWFSAGVAVGIAATVLFAPETGTQTRSRIRGIAHRADDV